MRRGVLLRPLGDVVVLMPPLTVTDDEIERIVDTLVGRDRRGGGGADAVTGPGDLGTGTGGSTPSSTPSGPPAGGGSPATWSRRVPSPASSTARPVVTFASNDYLGLTHHPRVVAAAHAALDRWGAGSGASRLVVGSRPLHAELEAELAAWKGTEAALLFPTGFAANLGVLATLGGPDVTILSDELNHASIVDGARLARAEVRVYGHADLDHLAKLLVDVDAAGRGPALVVTDSAFSMDGDVVDVAALVDVCAGHDALVVLDEAHAVLGPRVDAAAAADRGVTVLRMGTLSKALGSLGGFVAGPRRYVDLLRNRARPFIFTTAPTPADVAAALAAVRVVRSAEGDDAGGPPPEPRRPAAARAPHADRAGGARRRGGGVGRGRRPAGAGACWCPPSGRPRCRSGRPACASPCPPPTPTSRSTGWSPPWRRWGGTVHGPGLSGWSSSSAPAPRSARPGWRAGWRGPCAGAG